MNHINVNEKAPAPSKVQKAFQNTNRLNSPTPERIGTRFYSDAPDWSRLNVFNQQRIRQMLQNELSIDDEARLKTVTLALSPQAHATSVRFQDATKAQLATDKEMREVKDVASKVADNAARLAALSHVFEYGAGAVRAEAMARGAKVAAWHSSETRRFLGQFSQPVELMNAQRLDRWLIQHCLRASVTTVTTMTAKQHLSGAALLT